MSLVTPFFKHMTRNPLYLLVVLCSDLSKRRFPFALLSPFFKTLAFVSVRILVLLLAVDDYIVPASPLGRPLLRFQQTSEFNRTGTFQDDEGRLFSF